MTFGHAPRFDDAHAAAGAFVREHLAGLLGSVVVVRDLYGRLRIAVDDRLPAAAMDKVGRDALAEALHTRLGRFSPGARDIFLHASEMLVPQEVFASPDLQWVDADGVRYRFLERSLIGADWLRAPIEPEPPVQARLTLYGIKGGVGRSTAGAVLTWRLAQLGRRILVIDLDLESPDLGGTLLPEAQHPDFGIVDWLVEDAVGQADDNLLVDLVARSPLANGDGEILVVPAGGRLRPGYTYLPKLARAYADLGVPWQASDDATPDRTLTFADRLAALVRTLEARHEPDLTVLDSRAGLHDIAAATVTRLQATALLFAVDTAQTWRAYRTLFDAWKAHADRARAFRENLKMVSALTPETETETYLRQFRERAYDLFAETLYEETPPGELGTFGFDLEDDDAPHSPMRIHWSRSFQQFDPVTRPQAVTDEQLRAGFGDLVSAVHRLVFGEDVG